MVNTNNIMDQNRISLARASLIAGLGLIIMVATVPLAEFYIFPQLISQNSSETITNILNHKMLFLVGIFLHLITIVCDIIVAWALYILLRPVNEGLSLLTAWFRLIYTAIYLIALTNLIKVFNIVEMGKIVDQTNYLMLSDSLEFISIRMAIWTFSFRNLSVPFRFLGFSRILYTKSVWRIIDNCWLWLFY